MVVLWFFTQFLVIFLGSWDVECKNAVNFTICYFYLKVKNKLFFNENRHKSRDISNWNNTVCVPMSPSWLMLKISKLRLVIMCLKSMEI